MKCAVLIPVYKAVPSKDECASLRQCVTVLGEHDILLVCPESLDTSAYDEASGRSLSTQRFHDNYFVGIEGYNSLLFSTEFYSAFSSYDYMLVYQLDAWVFADKLDEWCSKGYDYIGAPWFYRNRSHEEGESLWLSGNGGLSLRKVDRFIEVTSAERIEFKLSYVFSSDFHRFSDRYKYLQHCAKFRRCSFQTLANSYRKPWEDLVFCVALRGSNYQLSVPAVDEASLFAMETSPAFVYDNVTHGQLPFGCHAWRKNEYESFWIKYIDVE